MKKVIYLLILFSFFVNYNFVLADEEKTENDEIVDNGDNNSNDDTSDDNSDNESSAESVEDINLKRVEIGDKFYVNDDEDDIYTVTELDTDSIYFGDLDSRELNIKHFEINKELENGKITSRKFINLDEFCVEGYCDIEESRKYDDLITISRQYVNSIEDLLEDGSEIKRDLWYTTSHEVGDDSFTSLLFVSNKYGITPGESVKQLNEDNDDDYGKFYTFGERGIGNFNTEGVLTGDVVSFKDKTGDIYVSLRFITEALGARVDWLKDEGEEGDAVLIRLYDSIEFCKSLDIEYNETRYSVEEMREHIIESAMQNQSFEIDLDLEFKYYDDDSKKIRRGSSGWAEDTERSNAAIFLSGNAVNFEVRDNTFGSLVEWKENKGKNNIFFNVSTQASNDTDENPFLKACPDNVEDNKLTSLDDCLEITGIILYYGVPIPIDLLDDNGGYCELEDDGTFEDNRNEREDD